MGSQFRSLRAVPNEIILRIVENMNTKTRESFMVTDKRTYTLIRDYEHSISKRRAASFILSPLGNVLSSSDTERCIVSKDTFLMVRELELRDKRINLLIARCPNALCVHSPPWLPCLTVTQQARLIPMIKRALYHCDRIADIAANEPGSPISPEPDHGVVPGMLRHPAVSTTLPVGDPSTFDSLAKPMARPKQIEYIRSLPLEDIAGVFVTINALGIGLMCSCMCSAPARYEQKTVIEESVLRHGTWFVWSRLLGGAEWKHLANSIIVDGWAELRGWESGAINGPPGLKMTLVQRFRELVGGEDMDVFGAKIKKTLEKLVLGDDKKHASSESGPDIE